MRLNALRKLIFGVHGVQEKFFRLTKKADRQVDFNCDSKAKFVVSIPKYVLRTRSLVRPRDDK